MSAPGADDGLFGGAGPSDDFDAIVAGLGDATEVPAALALVLTPVASASALAGLAAMAGLQCHVVPASSGAVAACYVEDDPMAELEDRPPAAVAHLAGELSRLVHTDAVALVSRLVKDADTQLSLEGQVAGYRFAGGEYVAPVAAGLVLASADRVVEDLAVGSVRLEDVASAEDTREIPRWKAARMFSRGLRKRKQ